MQKILKKSELDGFLAGLIEKYKLIAPTTGLPFKFSEIGEGDVDKIDLKRITQIPFKKYFIPDNEVLLEFKGDKAVEIVSKPAKTVVFGLRLCDINAIKILDKLIIDPDYILKRKNTILIGLHCDSSDKYCFCNSIGLEKLGFDLFFYLNPKTDNYHITIGSKKGDGLILNLPDSKTIYQPEIINKKILKNKKIDDYYENDVWKCDADKCLSCSACTVYCPTCNCFDIKDNLMITKNSEVKPWNRVKTETSCQLKSFTQIAGGVMSRESRVLRFKHFVYHKISYFKKSHGRYMCVGCGRCLRVCPTGIDWVRTLNELNDGTMRIK